MSLQIFSHQVLDASCKGVPGCIQCSLGHLVAKHLRPNLSSSKRHHGAWIWTIYDGGKYNFANFQAPSVGCILQRCAWVHPMQFGPFGCQTCQTKFVQLQTAPWCLGLDHPWWKKNNFANFQSPSVGCILQRCAWVHPMQFGPFGCNWFVT